ncbi:MAG TPA: HTH-type transcriptional activator IlvY, partial [Polyangiales bacterium]|nr:HTH-type transcriptional activator IlvY [Polyangiales bacterium]
MDTEGLRLFLHLSRTLHFGRTSQDCHISASALSRAIMRLESDAGAPLLLRDSRRVQLTAAGERFVVFAQETLAKWQNVQQTLRDTGGRLQGTLSIFCTVTAAYSLLPELLSKFRRSYPDVTLRLETGYAADALERVERGEVDVAVAALPDRVPRRLITRVFAHTPLLFVAPSSPCEVADLVASPVIDWSELPIVMPEHGMARQRIDRWFRDRRATPKVYGEVSGHEAILSLVALGCGVGIVPGLVLEKSPLRADVQRLPVRPQLPPFHLG